MKRKNISVAQYAALIKKSPQGVRKAIKQERYLEGALSYAQVGRAYIITIDADYNFEPPKNEALEKRNSKPKKK